MVIRQESKRLEAMWLPPTSNTRICLLQSCDKNASLVTFTLYAGELSDESEIETQVRWRLYFCAKSFHSPLRVPSAPICRMAPQPQERRMTSSVGSTIRARADRKSEA
jgi:hypothetical protein